MARNLSGIPQMVLHKEKIKEKTIPGAAYYHPYSIQ